MKSLIIKTILGITSLITVFITVGLLSQSSVWAYRQTFTTLSAAQNFDCPSNEPIKTINQITSQPGGPGRPVVTEWEVVCTSSNVSTPLGSISQPSALNRFGTGENGIGLLLQGFIGLLMVAAFILAFVFLVIGGIGFISGGGDKAKVESSRNKIIYAVVGIVVVLAAFAIINFVQGFFGVTIFGKFNIPGI